MSELDWLDPELERMAQEQRANRTTPPLPASFSIEATHDEEKSKAAGRPVYIDQEIIEIHIGRDMIRHPVTDADRKTYAAQYVAWKKGESQESVEGMPLAQWAAIPGKAIVRELAYMGIRTVEQLATATDATLQRVGPHQALRQKARDWVADAEKQAPLVKLRDENAALASRVAALEQMVQEQAREISAARQAGGVLSAPPVAAPPLPDIAAMVAAQVQAALAAQVSQPKRRGRPPKAKLENGEG